MSIGDAEIKTQERVLRFFKDPETLGYQYIGNLSDYQNKNIKDCLLYTSYYTEYETDGKKSNEENNL